MFGLIIVASLMLISVKASVPCGLDRDLCCNDGESCCRLSNGTLGCFPSENVVCCVGSSFACKEGYSCHAENNMCVDLDMVVPPIKPTRRPRVCEPKTFPLESSERCGPTGVCPGDQHRCCPNAQPNPACCPYPLGECCTDGLHCCPAGYKCDMDRNGCVLTVTSLQNVIHKLSRKLTKPLPGTVFCPDHSVCYDNQTCCHTKSGQYGCCPFQGVCCSDGQHCCPHDTVCDIFQQKCIKKAPWASFVEPTPESAPSKRKTEIPIKPKSRQIVCPDPSYQCPDNTTCCLLSSESYGCCPYPQAVCCKDGDHCCPNGFTCDTAHQRCISSRGNVEFYDSARTVQKRSSGASWTKYESDNISMKNMISARKQGIIRRVGEVLCPDKSSVCEDGTTCCQLPDKTYGCCPYVNATCCADHQHCCPMSYTCDLVHQQCAQSQEFISESDQLDLIPMGFVVIQTFLDDEPAPMEDKQGNAGSSILPFFQSMLSFLDGFLNSEKPNGKKIEKIIPGLELETKIQSSCSLLDALLKSCPKGSSCCQPVGENQEPICCPGNSRVSCCPGGFCCPEDHECNPLTLKCHRSTADSPDTRASLGVAPLNV